MLNTSFASTYEKKIVAVNWDKETHTVYYKIGSVYNLFVGIISDVTYNDGQNDNVTFSMTNINKNVEAISQAAIYSVLLQENVEEVVSSPTDILDYTSLPYQGVAYTEISESEYHLYQDRMEIRDTNWSQVINLSKYEKDYYYGVSLVRNFNIYQKIDVNSADNTIISNKVIYAVTSDVDSLRVLKYKNKVIDYKISNEKKITPITNYDAEEFRMFINAMGTKINTSKYLSAGGNRYEVNDLKATDNFTSWTLLNDLTPLLDAEHNFNMMRILNRNTFSLSSELSINITGEFEFELKLILTEGASIRTSIKTNSRMSGGYSLIIKFDDFIMGEITKFPETLLLVRVRRLDYWESGQFIIASGRHIYTRFS